MKSDDFYTTMGRLRGSLAERRLRHQMGFLYRDIDFKGKAVLDIGGGIGLHSFYTVSQGAKSATIIEPEGDGGHDQMITTFQSLRNEFGCTNVELIRTTFQEFSDRTRQFDIVLVQDAINHFDEPACITLRQS